MCGFNTLVYISLSHFASSTLPRPINLAIMSFTRFWSNSCLILVSIALFAVHSVMIWSISSSCLV